MASPDRPAVKGATPRPRHPTVGRPAYSWRAAAPRCGAPRTRSPIVPQSAAVARTLIFTDPALDGWAPASHVGRPTQTGGRRLRVVRLRPPPPSSGPPTGMHRGTHSVENDRQVLSLTVPAASVAAELPDWHAAAASMARVAAGDERALARLYDAYAPMLYTVALRVVRSEADAEEVVLETFTQLWREAARYDPERGS